MLVWERLLPRVLTDEVTQLRVLAIIAAIKPGIANNDVADRK